MHSLKWPPKYFEMVSWPQSESNIYLSLLQLSVRHKSPPEHRRLIDYLGAIRHFSKLIVGWLQCCQNLGVQIATWQHWLIVAISQIRSPLSRLFAIVAQKLRLRERWWRSHYVIQQWKSKKSNQCDGQRHPRAVASIIVLQMIEEHQQNLLLKYTTWRKTDRCTGFFSQSRAKLRDWAIGAGKGWLLPMYSIVIYWLKDPVQGGCRTGNGKKLSKSQACCLAQLCLAAT